MFTVYLCKQDLQSCVVHSTLEATQGQILSQSPTDATSGSEGRIAHLVMVEPFGPD